MSAQHLPSSPVTSSRSGNDAVQEEQLNSSTITEDRHVGTALRSRAHQPRSPSGLRAAPRSLREGVTHSPLRASENHCCSCRPSGSRYSFDAIAEATELLDHSGRACLLCFDVNHGIALLVPHRSCKIFQINRQSRCAMAPMFGNARDEGRAAIQNFEDAAFRLDGGVRGVIEQPTHVTVSLR